MENTEKNVAVENETENMTSLVGVSAKELAEEIAKILDSKKGRDIKVLHVEDKTVISEYFVLCTGTSNTHIKALAGEVEYKTEQRELSPYGVEGRDNNSFAVKTDRFYIRSIGCRIFVNEII